MKRFLKISYVQRFSFNKMGRHCANGYHIRRPECAVFYVRIYGQYSEEFECEYLCCNGSLCGDFSEIIFPNNGLCTVNGCFLPCFPHWKPQQSLHHVSTLNTLESSDHNRVELSQCCGKQQGETIFEILYFELLYCVTNILWQKKLNVRCKYIKANKK